VTSGGGGKIFHETLVASRDGRRGGFETKNDFFSLFEQLPLGFKHLVSKKKILLLLLRQQIYNFYEW
jgi:hypothetical protein